MVDFSFLTIKDKWLLAVIASTPYIEGRTRLQKYGILSFNEVLNSEEFFDDWQPDDFGGFSPKLASSLNKLERRNYVQSSEVITESGYPVNRYTLSEKGKNVIEEFLQHDKSKFEKIKSITSNYFQKSLKILLDDVYQKYPTLTTNSKIKADVNKTRTINHTYLSPKFEIPYDEEPQILESSMIPSQQHVFNDDDFRRKIAKSIGLDKTPDLDPKSFDRIKGILATKIETDDFNSEELVKEVRGC